MHHISFSCNHIMIKKYPFIRDDIYQLQSSRTEFNMKGIKIPNISALGFYLRTFAYDIYNTHTKDFKKI